MLFPINELLCIKLVQCDKYLVNTVATVLTRYLSHWTSFIHNKNMMQRVNIVNKASAFPAVYGLRNLQCDDKKI